MKNTIFGILTLVLLEGCNSSQRAHVIEKSVSIVDTSKDNSLKLNCSFSDPDTSLCGITLNDATSATKIIGTDNQQDNYEQYHFYSTLERETLTLTQHPGNFKNQISIFKVALSDKANYGYKLLNIDTFKTEKGIKLGLSKQQVIDRLGRCYTAVDSSKGYIELYYRIALPDDSKTSILAENNMPVYYASYKIWNDKLEQFEFGFEYP